MKIQSAGLQPHCSIIAEQVAQSLAVFAFHRSELDSHADSLLTVNDGAFGFDQVSVGKIEAEFERRSDGRERGEGIYENSEQVNVGYASLGANALTFILHFEKQRFAIRPSALNSHNVLLVVGTR
jgi:hypothetical protein